MENKQHPPPTCAVYRLNYRKTKTKYWLSPELLLLSSSVPATDTSKTYF